MRITGNGGSNRPATAYSVNDPFPRDYRMDLRRLAAPVLSFVLAAPLTAGAPPPGAIQAHADGLTWKPAPPSLPAGSESTVLEGDPRNPGLFTLRIRVPAGTRLLPHTHPRAERITVLSGALGLGFGTRFDPGALRVFRAGDYYVNPPGVPHYLSFAEDTVVQITTDGPWGLDYLPQETGEGANVR